MFGGDLVGMEVPVVTSVRIDTATYVGGLWTVTGNLLIRGAPADPAIVFSVDILAEHVDNMDVSKVLSIVGDHVLDRFQLAP